jgi:hypothetical protein
MSSVPPILVPDEFNAAAYFIDRHLSEGRAGKVAIECGEVRVTYGELAGLVNHFGNGLKSLGMRMEERVPFPLNSPPVSSAPSKSEPCRFPSILCSNPPTTNIC